MTKPWKLFGRKILPHHRLSLRDQLFDLFLEEIRKARWKVGDELPDPRDIAEQCGVDSGVVRDVYDRLKLEGAVEMRREGAAYVVALAPYRNVQEGDFALLIGETQREDSLIQWYEHVILGFGRRRRRYVEVRVLPEGEDPVRVLRDGGLFRDPGLGVISLLPFRVSAATGAGAPGVPLVFLVPPYENCAPRVSADVREAMYELTGRMVRAGCRRILFSEDAIEMDPRQSEMQYDGHAAAMRAFGLPVDEGFRAHSRAVENGSLQSVVGHLQAIQEAVGTDDVRTGVLTDSLSRAMAIVREAPRYGVRIPEEFGVASMGSAVVEEADQAVVEGVRPDYEYMVECCLHVLERIRDKGEPDFNRLLVRMHPVGGTTL